MFWKIVYSLKLRKRGHSSRESRNVGATLKLKPPRNGNDESVLGMAKVSCPRDESDADGVRKKPRLSEGCGHDDGPPEVDRISELPEAIVHHILSYMRCPKDVARTFILSKKWRNMCNSYLTFDFDERCFRIRGEKGKHNRLKFREVQKKKFKRYVKRSVESRIAPAPCIDKFRLCVSNFDDKLGISMGHWIHRAVEKNVKELEIIVNSKKNPYIFPRDVLVSKAITSLKLSGSVVTSFSALGLCNLRELSLKGVTVIELLIDKVERSCPLLEDFRLVYCNGLFCLTISELAKLRRLEVHECCSLICIEIKAPVLETFWYHAKKHQYCDIVFKGCGALKNLTLKDGKMSDTVFQSYISKCPLIENLVLQDCNRLERLTILSANLKSLSLLKCMKMKEVNVDAPNLYSFQYTGSGIPFSSMNVLGLCEAKFSFGHAKKTREVIVECQKFFGNDNWSRRFKLVVHTKQVMKIYEDLKEVDLDQNSFNKLELTVSAMNVVKIVDNWLRECHGRSLTLVSPSIELEKLIRMKIMNREDYPNCCGFYSKKCWRHYLADVQMVSSAQKTHYGFKWEGHRAM